MRTLVVSDLHLGSARGRDVLRRPGPLAALVEAVRGADRLVLLGDAIELRQGPLREALAAAAPVFAALGAALGPDGELVLVPGNHDHQLLAPWLQERDAEATPAPLGLEERPGPAPTRALARLAAATAPARFEVAYPGIWLRPDVFAFHGHYADRLITVPTFERIAAGAMVRAVGPLGPDRARPGDFEAALAPLYAWLNAVVQGRRPGRSPAQRSASAAGWQAITGDGPRTLRTRAVAAAFPLGVMALNRAGAGPVRAELSGVALRQAGLVAMGEVVRLLGVEAEHVVFGHTHRAGPLPADDPAEWRAPTGARLHNAGCWVDEPTFTLGDPENPYWAGRVVVLEDTGPPRLERVVGDLG